MFAFTGSLQADNQWFDFQAIGDSVVGRSSDSLLGKADDIGTYRVPLSETDVAKLAPGEHPG